MFCSECGLPEPIKAFLQMWVHEDMGEQTHTVFHASRQLSFVAGLGNHAVLHFAKFRLTVQTEVITDRGHWAYMKWPPQFYSQASLGLESDLCSQLAPTHCPLSQR